MADSFVDKVINFLNKIDAMKQSASRDQLLLNLPPGPRSNIARRDSTFEDLSKIVEAANNWGKLKSGEFALKIVMTNARKYVEGLRSENDLDDLISELDSKVKSEQNEIEIPFVIVAMTQSEINGLIQQIPSNQVEPFNDEFKKFQELTQLLETYDVTNFVHHYSDNREEWKPFILPKESIKTVIADIINNINSASYELANIPLIKPIFYSEDCFEENYSKRVKTWDYLRKSGCIIIVDAISLFHHKVREKLLKAEITSNKNVAILVLSPVNPCEIKANKLLGKMIQFQMEPAFLRFNEDCDKLCEIGIGDLRAIKRWFVSIIPETVENITKRKPLLKNRQVVRRKMGIERTSGLDKLWTQE